MKQVALVTGCFGFIGSHIVDSLLERGYRVLGVGNPRDETNQFISSVQSNPNFDLVGHDITDPELGQSIDEDIESIFHLAVNRSSENQVLLKQVNITGTVKMLELARKRNTRRFVFSSSAAVYGNPDQSPITEDTPVNPVNHYGASKAAGEMTVNQYNQKYGLETVILRYFNVFGPRQSPTHGAISIFINNALRDVPITIEGNGTYRYTPVYVGDVVSANMLASQIETAAGSTINITGNETIKILDIAHKVKKLIQKSTSEIIFSKSRPQWKNKHIGSIDTMKRILGLTPAKSFDVALEETVQWYLNSW
ncbi:MAG: NAD-dependent epimerase/dehydratase family protein [Candidatus Thorarchaeota archaeon]